MLKYYIIGGLLLLNIVVVYYESIKEKQMSKKKRPCEFRKRTLIPMAQRTSDKIFSVTTEKGLFHKFGTSASLGQPALTMGIIEDENGQVHTVVPSDIQFTD